MQLHLIRGKASDREIEEMLSFHGTFIKLAVDVRRGILVGGGEFHADCEELLLENGSEQVDVWGADWDPGTQRVSFEALINIRPRQGNRSMTIQDAKVREMVEAVTRSLLRKE